VPLSAIPELLAQVLEKDESRCYLLNQGVQWVDVLEWYVVSHFSFVELESRVLHAGT